MRKLIELRRGSGVVLLAASALVASACGSSSGEDGDEGSCAAGLVAGDLVVSEIMANPSGADESNEWWEIFNATSETVSLEGVELVSSQEDKSGAKLHRITSAITVEPGGYVVVGGVLDEAKPAHVDYGYANDLGDLRNTAGRVAILCGNVTVDEAIYVEASDGASRGLDGAQVPDSVSNDDLTQWCDATTPFDGGDFGSPGAANEPCAGGGSATTCSEGGTERDVNAPQVGDLVITEFMPNPSAVADSEGEWFEVRVNADVDLNGLEIGNTPGEVDTTLGAAECLSVTAGTHLVFASNEDSAANGGLPSVDFLHGASLSNSGGELFIGRGGEVLDAIVYTGSSDGASTQLDPRRADPTANDDEANWCPAMDAYGAGDLGTPGAENVPCNLPAPPGQCDDGGTLRDVVTPVVGDLVISEAMPNPAAVPDADGEWFEITATRDVDLSGLEMGQTPGDVSGTLDARACLRVTAGSSVIVAKNLDGAANGGLPTTDLSFSFSLVNSSGGVFIGIDGTVLDAVTWATSTAGASLSLDPGSLDPTANDDAANWCDAVDAYGAGDLGTPAAANTMCGAMPSGDECNDGGTMRAIEHPAASDLVINELMPNPAGTESENEWFEVLVTRDVDLNGLVIGRQASTQEFTVTSVDCQRVTAGTLVLFGRDTTTNGGLPTPDVVYGTVTLVNSSGSLELRSGMTVVDAVTWSSSTDGESISLDPSFANATDNDVAANWCAGVGTYGPGGMGTPQAVNAACM